MITNSYLPDKLELLRKNKKTGEKEQFTMKDFLESIEFLQDMMKALRQELSSYVKEFKVTDLQSKRSSLYVYKKVRKCIEIVLMAEEIQKRITNLHKLLEKRKKYKDLKVYKVESHVRETPTLIGTIYHEIDQYISTSYKRITNLYKSQLDTTEMYQLSKLKVEMKQIIELNHKFQLLHFRLRKG